MSKPIVILADTDVNYLATLEYKFLEALGDRIELEIITDSAYFDEYFSSPKTAEIVAVGESLYTRDLQRHNISNLFVLAEEMESGSTEELSVVHIFKYTGIKEIFNELVYRSRDRLAGGREEQKETKVIALYAAIGGTGKTCLSLGLADSLYQNHQRVLYVNTESMQSFAYYLKDKTGMPNEAYRYIRDGQTNIYGNVKSYIRQEGFSYVPPFMATLDALNLKYSVYLNLIKSAKESGEYDFIIVDIESGYDRDKMELLMLADKVMMIMRQDAVSLFKTEYLLRNIDVRNKEKYLFLCNKYDDYKENAYLNSQMQKQFTLNEYIEYAYSDIENVGHISALSGIQKLAYMFI